MRVVTLPVRLALSQIGEAGSVLGRAFHDDPMFKNIIPDDAKRALVMPCVMNVAVQYGHLHGEVYTTTSKVEGVAVWLSLGNPETSLTGMLRTGMFLIPLKFGVKGLRRYVKFARFLRKLHKRDVPPQHWYLMFLGVDPPRQGHGIGSSLIQPVLSRADADRVPCYLENMRAENVTFYQKHGFEVVVEDNLPKCGIRFWTMKREPQA